MIALDIILDGDGAWTDLRDGGTPWQEGDLTAIAALPNGMASGAASVAFRIALPDGGVVVAQTSAALFVEAARAIAERYKIHRDDVLVVNKRTPQ